jgi:hypothetical protein
MLATSVGFYVGFGAFVVLLLVLFGFIISFAVRLGRRDGTGAPRGTRARRDRRGGSRE